MLKFIRTYIDICLWAALLVVPFFLGVNVPGLVYAQTISGPVLGLPDATRI